MLELRNISVKIKNNIILNDFSYEFQKGIYHLEGENGSGKTTLLNAIFGNVNYDGIININGTNLSIEDRRNNYISYLMQEPNLIENLTIAECIRVLGNENEKITGSFAQKLGFNVLRKEKVRDLSCGDKKKIALICLLSQKKPILILDEPDNDLDDKTVSLLKNILLEYDGIVIYTSHNMHIQGETLKINENMHHEGDKSKIKNNNILSPNEVSRVNVEKPIYKIIKKRFKMINVLFLILMLSVGYIFNQQSIHKAEIISNLNLSYGNYNSDNVAILEAPLENKYFNYYGTSEWFEKMPFFLDEDFYNELKKNELIVDIKPINDLSIKSRNFIYDNKVYTNSFPFSSIEHSVSTKTNFVEIPSDKLEGAIPKDDTNEVVISEKIVDDYNLEIGDEFKAPATSEDGEETSFMYKIVGINHSEIPLDIVGAYQNSQQNGLYRNMNTSEVVMENEVLDYSKNTNNPNLSEDLKDEEYYYAIYIETETKEDLALIEKEVYKYDPYISFTSNNEQSINRIMYYQNVYNKSMIIQFIIIAFVVTTILLIMIVLDLKDLKRNLLILTYYDYNIEMKMKIFKLNTLLYKRIFLILLTISLVFSMLNHSVLSLCILLTQLVSLLFILTILNILEKKYKNEINF